MEKIIVSMIKEIASIDKLERTDHLIDEVGLDSLRMLFLITKIEERFGFSIKDEDLAIENFETVDAIVSLVKKYQAS